MTGGSPSLGGWEHGPGLLIPAYVSPAGLRISPKGATTTVDLTTLPLGLAVPIRAMTPGEVVLDAGALGVIAPPGCRAAKLEGTEATVVRANLRRFRLSGVASPVPDPPPRSRRLLIAGQSLAWMWVFTPALAAFCRRRAETGDRSSVGMIVHAQGGSAALGRYAPERDRTLYWWDERAQAPGPLLEGALAMLQGVPRSESPTHVLWVQGEQDSRLYDPRTDPAEFQSAYANAVIAILAALRRAVAGASGAAIPAYVQGLGPRRDPRAKAPSMTMTPGMALVRAAQADVIAAPGANIRWGARPDVTLPLRDGVHPTDAGFESIGEMTAQAFG